MGKYGEKHEITQNSDGTYLFKSKKTGKKGAHSDMWNNKLSAIEALIRKQTTRKALDEINLDDPVPNLVDFTGALKPEADLEGKGFRKLGNKTIHYKNLVTKNKLDIRQPSKSNIFGFPVATVSDLFVNFVHKLLKGENVSDGEIKQLKNICSNDCWGSLERPIIMMEEALTT